ncbi:AzlD domain-containing protein [Pseudotabrizicola sediminis]|uniref:AzlD domain-containing protein n=1 Tax=Pseudotabrizicola sediminis TaxID=2486418 RepID=A0ABY2KPQ6_9RHOB|nr:AzlD domain-containing protein [Pseudotabrizicola sediminis]TGD44702.1 AzlD domain-containing protein [Pseudotabrizicola sediminis]TGD67608.1 AzlD domain-containing protein [Tabrizicola sp. WMC-M-20]
MKIDPATFWIVLPALAIGTYLIRLSFLGVLGNQPLPAGLRRALRYTAVAILPGLVAPAVLWPAATGGETDPARLAAACVTLGVGIVTRSVIGAILAGGVTLYAVLWL